MDQAYAIRQMSRSDLDTAVEWAANEGWNPGRADRDTFYDTDPSGFFMGFIGETPVSSISLVKYGRDFGFLGFYLVAPEFRGQGYGLALWQHAMDSAKGRTIGLDGVVDQQDNYKKSGFKLAFRNIRYQGRGGTPAPDAAGLLPIEQIVMADLLAYDAPFFPADRRAFLSAWASQPGSQGLGRVRNGRIEGYGIMRPCRQGFKIGPLFADTPDGADLIFRGLASSAGPDDPVFLDTPEPNRAALDLAAAHGMTPCFETARMYTGPFPELPMDRLFGITSFELG